jgi:hypothetical protein
MRHDPIDPARSPGLRPFLVALVVAGVLGSADAVPQPLDVVRPTAVAIVHTQPGADVCWTSGDEEDRDADALNTIVMRAILQCGYELGLSEGQMDRLEAVADAFVRETAGRQARLGMMQLDLLAGLRPDPTDPAKPADIEAAELKIREIARITVEQDMALLRAIEALKAVLTAEQRVTLAGLLVASRPAIL